jgi:Na+-driven multidrug efflux pump
MVVGICRAGGDTIFCGIFDTAFMWFTTLPLAAALSYFFHVPATVIFICLCGEEIFKFFAGIRRYRSGKWLHNVVEGI